MKISVLVENSAMPGFCAEHGLSLLVEYNERNYLLDAGTTAMFRDNANQLGIDLSLVDTAVLSHAHTDHYGGMEAFFAANSKAKLYLREESKQASFIKYGFVKFPIGFNAKWFDAYKERCIFVQDKVKLEDGVWLIPHRQGGYPERGKRVHMYRRGQTSYLPDDFMHEQSLVFETDRGLVILNSCSHAGIDHIVNEVKQAIPGKEIAAVIGGFHLMGLRGVKSLGMKKEEVVELADHLKQLQIHDIYTGHCTGLPGFQILKQELGEHLHALSTGMVFEQ